MLGSAGILEARKREPSRQVLVDKVTRIYFIARVGPSQSFY